MTRDKSSYGMQFKKNITTLIKYILLIYNKSEYYSLLFDFLVIFQQFFTISYYFRCS